MKRRGFLQALLGAPAIPLVAKAVPSVAAPVTPAVSPYTSLLSGLLAYDAERDRQLVGIDYLTGVMSRAQGGP